MKPRHTKRTAKASSRSNATPTDQSYPELQEAFDHFNGELFDDQLPPCLMTLQRRKRSYGYFSAGRFTTKDGSSVTDEIAMNPTHFWDRPLIEALSTLVHEMTHLWQFHFGKPGRGRYHNKQWANRMEELGLMPSHTGTPGGKRTGQQMAHYVIAGGPFELAANDLLTSGFEISWGDVQISEPKGIRPRFTCPSCGLNAWAKPTAELVCGTCEVPMVFCTIQKQTGHTDARAYQP